MTTATGPLAGVKIVDITTVVMGPMAVQMLGDMGADVIKIEEPGGDMMRNLGLGPRSDMSGMALNLLRNYQPPSEIVDELRHNRGRTSQTQPSVDLLSGCGLSLRFR
jgi:CoA-transferase family III